MLRAVFLLPLKSFLLMVFLRVRVWTELLFLLADHFGLDVKSDLLFSNGRRHWFILLESLAGRVYVC